MMGAASLPGRTTSGPTAGTRLAPGASACAGRAAFRLAARVFMLVLALSVLFPGPAMARTVLDLDPAVQPVPLSDWGDAWIDPTGQVQTMQIESDTSIPWQPTADHAIYSLSTGKTLWIRLTVPPAPDAERWYLEIPYPSVNRVTLYLRDNLGEWVAQAAGDSIAVASWPVPHRHPLLPIAISAEEPRKYLIRIENAHSFGAPLQFISESHLSRTEQRVSLILGIYFGLAALAVMLAALSAVSLRDGAYALYGLTVFLMSLTQASLTGIAGLHLWPRSPWWNDVSVMVLPVLAVGVMQGFFIATVSLRERSRRLFALLGTTAALSVVVAAALMLVEPSQRFKLMVPYIAFATTSALGAAVWTASRGDRYALWLLFGALPVSAGAAFPLLRTAGLIPLSFLTEHGMQVGIALELPVLLFMLMLRSQHRREYRRRMLGLDRIDPTTGLINAPVFHERLARLIARSQRLKLRSAVLLVDIVNLDAIRRDFDGAAAEELPLRVAGRLLSASREIDSVARLSEHRFGLLLEGPLTAHEVAEAGPRAVARCLMPFKNRPLEYVARVHVAQALVPQDGTDPDWVVAQLELLLASIPPGSRRAVFTLAKVAAPPAASATPA